MLTRSAFVAGVAATLTAAFLAAPAAEATASHTSAAGVVFDLGPTPSSVIPGNCPFPGGDLTLTFTNGNMVNHGEENKNGDWGGQTIEGDATFAVDGTTVYTGHATIWGGGGNNAKAQTEGGFTLSYNGTGPAGALSLHVEQHSTTNASGTPTANTFNVSIVCS